MPREFPKALGRGLRRARAYAAWRRPGLVWETIAKRNDCDPVRNGTLQCAVAASGLAEIEERARQWGERGAPVRVLTAAEAAKRIGSVAYAGALLDQRAGTIQPLAYARGLARAAIAAGVEICTRSAVRAAERTGGAWLPRPAAARSRPTGWRSRLTLMAGALASGASRAGPSALFQLRHAAAQRELQASILPGREGCWDTKTILSSFRFDRAGRLVFGSVGALRGTGLLIHRAWAKRALRKFSPHRPDEIEER